MIDSIYKGKFGKEVEALPETTLTAISNLKAETVNFEGKAVNVLGYYSKGDGGGGLFYWDAASTEADNGGTIIQATAITTGRWKRVFSGAVNVKWFDGIEKSLDFIQSESNYSDLNIQSEINLNGEDLVVPIGVNLVFSDVGKLKNGKIIFKGSNTIYAGIRQVFADVAFQIFKTDLENRVVYSTLETTPRELVYTSGNVVTLLDNYTFYEYGDFRPVLTGIEKTPLTVFSIDVNKIYNVQPVRLGKLINNEIIRPEWFGCFPNLPIDTTVNFQKAIDFQQITVGAKILVSNGEYLWSDRTLSQTNTGKDVKGCLNIYGFIDIESDSKKGRNSEQPADNSNEEGSVIIRTNGYRVFRRHNDFHRYTTEVFASIRNVRFIREKNYTTVDETDVTFKEEKKKAQSAHLFHHLLFKSGVIDNITAEGYGIVLNGGIRGVTLLNRSRWIRTTRSSISGRGYGDEGIYGSDGWHQFRWAAPFVDSFISGGNYFNGSTSIYARDSCCFEIHSGSKTIITGNFFDFWSAIISAPYYSAIEGLDIYENTFDFCYRLSCPYHVLVREHDYFGFFSDDTYEGDLSGVTWSSNSILNHKANNPYTGLWHTDEWMLFDFSMREAFVDTDGNNIRHAIPSFSNTIIKDNIVDSCDKLFKIRNTRGSYGIIERGTVLKNMSVGKQLSDYVDFQGIGFYNDNTNRNDNYFGSLDNKIQNTIPLTNFSLPKPNIYNSTGADSISVTLKSTSTGDIYTTNKIVSKSFNNQKISINGTVFINIKGSWQFLSGQTTVDENFLWESPHVDGVKVEFLRNLYKFKKTNNFTVNDGFYFWDSGFTEEIDSDKNLWFTNPIVKGTRVLYDGTIFYWNDSIWAEETYKGTKKEKYVDTIANAFSYVLIKGDKRRHLQLQTSITQKSIISINSGTFIEGDEIVGDVSGSGVAAFQGGENFQLLGDTKVSVNDSFNIRFRESNIAVISITKQKKNTAPIDGTYTTEAAMHLDQANQLEGYGYL